MSINNLLKASTSIFYYYNNLDLHKEGKTLSEIARITRFSRCGIQSIINKYRETSSVIDKPRTGRPKKLSNKDEQYLKIISLRNRKTSVELTTELAEGTGVVVHPSTVQSTFDHCSIVQFLCSCAYFSLLVLFPFLNRGILTATHPLSPDFKSDLHTVDLMDNDTCAFCQFCCQFNACRLSIP